MDASRLGARQEQVLTAIRRCTEENGYPPTIRELCVAVGLRSPSSVAHHLDRLEAFGLISRDGGSPRAIGLRDESPAAGIPRSGQLVPLVGEIAAGCPIFAEENIEDMLAVPASLVGQGEFFALRVRGDSMIEAAICDGDIVVVRRQPVAESGQIVAALLGDEATVKELRRNDGHVELVPRNPHYPVIPGDEATILGRVVSVMRRLP
jgi:repressor LexA